MSKQLVLKSILVFMLLCSNVLAQPIKELPVLSKDWIEDYQPFRIAGNLYYVGTTDLGSYLITTPEGHILINTGVASSAAMIRKHVEALGFSFSDIRILLATHAHYDHVGAMAEIKKQTNAIFMMNRKDAGVMADGGKSDYYFGGDTSIFEPVSVDRLLDDSSIIKLGGMEIVALHHPGHTKGATSFSFDVSDSNRKYRVLIANIPSIIFNQKFSELKTYPNALADYNHTFNKLKRQNFDIWLASHGSQFGLLEKHKQGDRYNPMVFADRKGYDDAINKLYAAYREKLKKE